MHRLRYLQLALLLTALISCFALSPVSGFAADNSCTEDSTACWNHFDSKGIESRLLAIPQGSPAYVVVIQDTCPEFFGFSSTSILIDRNNDAGVRGTVAPGGARSDWSLSAEETTQIIPCDATAHELPVVHKSEFRGARVEVALKPGYKDDSVKAYRLGDANPEGYLKARMSMAAAFTDLCMTIDPDLKPAAGDSPSDLDMKKQTCLDDLKGRSSSFLQQALSVDGAPGGEVRELRDSEFIVEVSAESPWIFEFSGGPVVSDLVNEQYAVVDGVVVRDQGAEDDYSLGFAGFMHVANSDWFGGYGSRIALSLGLGVDNQSDLSLYFGPSWRLGDQSTWHVTAGVNFGNVDRLPNGQELGKPPISGDNTLNNLSSKTESAVFISISYSFGTSDSVKAMFEKPFQTKNTSGE